MAQRGQWHRGGKGREGMMTQRQCKDGVGVKVEVVIYRVK